MRGQDKIGVFARWGEHGKKYYYTAKDRKSREAAQEKAHRQGMAIKASQGRQDVS